jgi:hypothetical protein
MDFPSLAETMFSQQAMRERQWLDVTEPNAASQNWVPALIAIPADP